MPRAPRPPRRLTAATCLTALVLSGVGATPLATAAPGAPDAEDLLASLDADQRTALNRLGSVELDGLQVDDDVLTDDDPVDVVVSLTQPPAETARALAAAEGRTLSRAAADRAVRESQRSFADELAEMPRGSERSAKPAVRRTYTETFNGASLTLPGTELDELADLEAVGTVWLDEEVHATSTATTVAAGEETDDQARIAAGLDDLHDDGLTGEGITVGVIDSGIDHRHPDLADAYAGGHDFVDDDEDPMETTYADWQASGRPETQNGSTYYTQHGTHVAGIVAGRGDPDAARSAAGVAPEATVRAYRVLGPYGSGSTSDVLAGMDAALQDGVDVVNMSLGAPSNDALSPQAMAADHLVLAGVTTIIAAGNSGPDAATLGTPGAAALPITVGANDTPLELPQLTATLGDATATGRLVARSHDDPATTLVGGEHGLVDAGLGRSADYSGVDVAGRIAVVERGSITLNEKVERAASKGAAGVLLVNATSDGHVASYLGESTEFVPTLSMTSEDWSAFAGALRDEPDASVTFADGGTFTLGGDQVASFSSRGPVWGTGTIKPEVTAPGVSVLSSVPADVVDPEGRDYSTAYARLSGTSMASPYVAGVAALLLHDDPARTPADVKTALMNTAAPLERADDVLAVGAGQVDPWAAVHARVSAAVTAETPLVDAAGELLDVRHRTGAVDFGTLPAGAAVDRRATVAVTGALPGRTTYDVTVTPTGDGPDAAANGVDVAAPGTVTRSGHGTRSLDITLRAPASAAEGTYQGVITLTPRDAERVTLRLPYAVRLAATGLSELTMLKPTLSTHQGTGEGLAANGQGEFAFRMDGELRELQVFLSDTDGHDIGYVGAISTIGLAEEVLYGPASFTGSYHPLTDDPDNPVSPRSRWADEGAYRLTVVGVAADGSTDTLSRPIFVDRTAPTYDDEFGPFTPNVPTVVERPADATTYPLDGVLRDPSVPAIRAAGIDTDQSDNVLQWSVYSANVPESIAHPDADGQVHGEVTFPNGPPVTTMFMWPADAAGNWADRRKVNFVKEGIPYVVGAADTAKAAPGDVVTYTMTAHHLEEWGSFRTQLRYDSNLIEVLSVDTADATDEHDPTPVEVSTEDAGYGSWKLLTASFDVPGPEGLTADELPLLTVSYEVLDAPGWTLENGLSTGTTAFTATDGTSAQLQQFYGAVERLNSRSSVSGRVAPEAMLTDAYAFDPDVDYTTAGTSVTLTAPDGTVRTAEVDETSRYGFDELPLTEDAYRLEVRVPGHFTWYEEMAADTTTEGGQVVSTVPSLTAGDVNGDDVVDVRDALAMLAARGSADPAADLDRSGTVDRADLAWVRANYLAQNGTADRVTTPVTRHHGKTLEDVESSM